MFCKADASTCRHDNVVDDADVHERESVSDFLSNLLVGCTGFGDTARVVVHQDTGGGVVLKRFLHDVTGMHARTIDGAAEEVLAGDHPVPAIEVADAEDFVLKCSEAQYQIVAHGSR